LDSLSRLDRYRRIIVAKGVDFSSNDYLGLAHHDGIRQSLIDALNGGMDLGAGGSRLLRGNHPAHESLESFAVDFFGAEAALFMATGYLANLSLFATLAQRGDVIVCDERIHASAKEGIHASNAKHAKFAHNDAGACEDAVKHARKQGAKQVWIAVESVYSMDGDMAPLHDIMAIAERHDAFVIVDEAHATGVHGPGGRGLSTAFEGRANLIAMHTCGKALGQAGALVTLPGVLKEYLINCARAFIYTTAPPPLTALAVERALHVVQNEPDRREKLFGQIEYARAKLAAVFGPLPGSTQILPLIVGEDTRAVALAQALQTQGFDVRAIRAPTVAEGTARLRISITLNASREDIDALSRALAHVLAEVL
ncbi:MAG: 8-amino-7-oxononanoate synthase, partial [Rhodospirillales bacterium]|nr:8-amino-7-oxononanoate synthase [Rhodospirillales bacterium]